MKSFSEFDLSTTYHWDSYSEQYASAHILVQYLRTGWQADNRIGVTRHYFHGQRHVDVFYFALLRANQKIELPVLSSPSLLNIVRHIMSLQLFSNLDHAGLTAHAAYQHSELDLSKR